MLLHQIAMVYGEMLSRQALQLPLVENRGPRGHSVDKSDIICLNSSVSRVSGARNAVQIRSGPATVTGDWSDLR